nr:undecaprenyl-phosphate glucose phosphotransferase [uncultured Bacteroides sp.]
MKRVLRFNKVIKSIIITGDLGLLNIIFIVIYHIMAPQMPGVTSPHSLVQLLVLLNLIYIICNYSHGVILHQRIVRPEHIIRRAMRNTFFHAVVFISLISLANFGTLSTRFFVIFYALFLVVLIAYRLTFRTFIKIYRRSGGNSRTAIFIGDGENMTELHRKMTSDPTSGFRILGYFAENESALYPKSLPYLGHPHEVLSFIRNNGTEHVYCGLSSAQSEEILPILNYCENHLIHFFSVPDVRNYLKRRMHLETIGNVPIFYIRREPLAQLENRLFKRLFDLTFALAFLCTFFPIIYIIVGIAIKITSPGPIFFKQKRSGEKGKEFWCYKFRSMRVNKDCDKLQATRNDPRKTRLGNFLRKSNIDELPQFINVLLGDMSIVGPRPHMLKHTEEYSKLIDKYMVRHLVKPGITGWAQTNGFRGETKELWQMEGRVERDIWYLEHWTFMLDIYIIYKTVKNVIQGEKKAY